MQAKLERCARGGAVGLRFESGSDVARWRG
jgi:hypothetical protein